MKTYQDRGRHDNEHASQGTRLERRRVGPRPQYTADPGQQAVLARLRAVLPLLDTAEQADVGRILAQPWKYDIAYMATRYEALAGQEAMLGDILRRGLEG